MGTVSNKVYAATGTAAVGVYVSQIVIWILEGVEHIQVPTSVEDAIQGLFVAGCTFLAGYLAPHGNGNGPAHS